jgi:hypothetical protein
MIDEDKLYDKLEEAGLIGEETQYLLEKMWMFLCVDKAHRSRLLFPKLTKVMQEWSKCTYFTHF